MRPVTIAGNADPEGAIGATLLDRCGPICNGEKREERSRASSGGDSREERGDPNKRSTIHSGEWATGFRKEVALKEIAVEVDERILLLTPFNSLGNDSLPHIVGKRNERTDDLLLGRALVDIANQANSSTYARLERAICPTVLAGKRLT